MNLLVFFSVFLHIVVQLLSTIWHFATPWTAASQAHLSSTVSQSLSKFMSILAISFSATPFSFCLQSFLASGFFSNELALCVRWPKYCSFSCSISPSNAYSGLISFRIDWFHLLAVQGTLKSLLQHHNSKASIFLHLAFFMVQLFPSVHNYWKNHRFDYTDLCQ